MRRITHHIFLFTVIFFGLITAVIGQTNYYQKAKNTINIDSSIIYLEKYLTSIPTATDTSEIIEAYCLLANNYMAKSQYSKAEKKLQLVLNLPYTSTHINSKSFIQIEYGNLYKYQGNYSLALKYYLKAYDQLKNSTSTSYFLKCNINLAEYFRKLGKYTEAKKYINNAFKLISDNPTLDKKLIIRAYSRAAAIANESNNLEDCAKHANKCLTIAKEINDIYNEASIYNELGYMYKNLKQLDTAITLYKKAEKLFFAIGADQEAVNCMSNRAMLYAHAQYPKKQIFDLYHQIIDEVNIKNIDYSLENIYLYLYIENANIGDTGKAFHYLYDYHKAMMDFGSKIYNQEITNITEKYENDKVKKEIQTVSGELDEKIDENKRIYIFLLLLLLMMSFIGFLAYRLTKSKNKLAERNQEKDMLLKEIHHRVKNNLQVVSSLLELQTQKISDQSTIDIMIEGQNRVKAMSLIHKKLYQNDNLAAINFQDYIEDLCATLYQIYKTSNKEVEHEINTNNISFDIDTAIPLGLIINELVTNSYKYAFVNVEHPKLIITLTNKQDGTYQLLVSDNGNGLPKDFNINKTKTLGLMLVKQLTQQLFGKLTYEHRNNSTFYIIFKDTFTRKLID